MRFLRESKNGFVISDHMDSLLPKKTEDPKKVHWPWQQHVLVLIVGKKQQTDPRGEDKKEKQYKLRIRNVYISAETQLLEQNTP